MTDLKNNNSRKVTARVRNDLYKWLKEWADEQGISLSAALNMAIAKFMSLDD